jgi:hypothetical protein
MRQAQAGQRAGLQRQSVKNLIGYPAKSPPEKTEGDFFTGSADVIRRARCKL